MLYSAQVYNLFRQLGLRHIFVVPRASRVIGMITRKDLLIEVFNWIIPLYVILSALVCGNKKKIFISG